MQGAGPPQPALAGVAAARAPAAFAAAERSTAPPPVGPAAAGAGPTLQQHALATAEHPSPLAAALHAAQVCRFTSTWLPGTRGN